MIRRAPFRTYAGKPAFSPAALLANRRSCPTSMSIRGATSAYCGLSDPFCSGETGRGQLSDSIDQQTVLDLGDINVAKVID